MNLNGQWIENFSKRILCFCDSAEDAYKVEEFLVTDNLIKRDDCYNMKVGGVGGPTLNGIKNGMYGKTHTLETRKKMSEAHKGKESGFKGKMTPKYKWLTPSGEIKIMCISKVHRWHPYWVMVE